ncbi:MAG: Em GEA1 (EM1) [Candidatus Sericytochromatia bacterium]|nr:Em GEA1 (EM1) [Candidatus Sericytochromatia bacterium]
MTVRQAGHLGDGATKNDVETGELPKDFYAEIGHKGGQKVKNLIAQGAQAQDQG